MTSQLANLMPTVAEYVGTMSRTRPDVEWHTVTVTLNGQHGGVDVALEGSMEEWGEVMSEAVIQ